MGEAFAALGTALFQFINSEKGRAASDAERRRLIQLYEKINLPDFDPRDITPEDYKVIGTYTPEIAPYVAEEAPQVLQESAITQEGMQAQRDALARLREAAATSEDPQFIGMVNRAVREAERGAQARQGSIMENFARRGQLGSGLEMAAQMQGGADAAERAAIAGESAAADAYRNRLQMLRDSASLGKDIRGQDLGMQEKNIDIINAFNQRAAQAQRDWGKYRAGEMNEAQLKNLSAAQRASDLNKQARYNAAIGNRDYRKGIQQQQLENVLSKTRGLAGQYEGRRQDIIGRTQDRGQQIQGVGEGIGKAYDYYDKPSSNKSSSQDRPTNPNTGIWDYQEPKYRRDKDDGQYYYTEIA